jgi:hypothetical protein
MLGAPSGVQCVHTREQNEISKQKRKREYQHGELDSLLTRTEERKPNLADRNSRDREAPTKKNGQI